MTDKQIIKAKAYYKYGIDCDIFSNEALENAKTALWAFEEVNRQQAEIEDLKEQLKECKSFPHFTKDTQFVRVSRKADGQFTADKMIQVEVDKIRAEAIKEFAERLKEKLKGIVSEPTNEQFDWILHDYVPRKIDNLVKELTEGGNGFRTHSD